MAAWARENAPHLDAAGLIDMLTITAPGVDWLPWDRSKCRHGEGVKCSGRIGCRVEQWAADDWNEHAMRRLSLLWDSANRAVERRGFRAGRGRPPWLKLPELQARGVLHWHLLFSARDRPYVEALRQELARLGPLHGFGPQVDFTPCHRAGASKGVAYVVKAAQYVAKAADVDGAERRDTRALLQGPFRGRPFMSASPKLTRASRVTMRNLRDRRTLYARGVTGGGLPCASVETVMELERSREAAGRAERHFLGRLEAVFGDRSPPVWRRPRRWPLPPDPGRLRHSPTSLPSLGLETRWP
jgi:hypothetical protein